jgi:hypothetical protein
MFGVYELIYFVIDVFLGPTQQTQKNNSKQNFTYKKH